MRPDEVLSISSLQADEIASLERMANDRLNIAVQRGNVNRQAQGLVSGIRRVFGKDPKGYDSASTRSSGVVVIERCSDTGDPILAGQVRLVFEPLPSGGPNPHRFHTEIIFGVVYTDTNADHFRGIEEIHEPGQWKTSTGQVVFVDQILETSEQGYIDGLLEQGLDSTLPTPSYQAMRYLGSMIESMEFISKAAGDPILNPPHPVA